MTTGDEGERTPFGRRLQELRVAKEGAAAVRRTSERLGRPVDGLVVPLDVANQARAAFMWVRHRWPEAVLTSELALSFHTTSWADLKVALGFAERHLGDVSGILFFDDPDLGGVVLPLRDVLQRADAFLEGEPYVVGASTEDGSTGLVIDYGPDPGSGGEPTYSFAFWKDYSRL